METAFDLMLWRSSLAEAPPVPSGRDLADWAQRLSDAGEEGAAALLLDVAALHIGFSPQAMATRQEIAPSDPTSLSMSGQWTIHRAVDELLGLARLAASVCRPRLIDPPRPVPSGRPDNPAGIGDGIPAPPMTNDVAVTARRLRALLESPAAASVELEALLAELVEADRRFPDLDYRPFAQAPLGTLVPVIAMIGLIDFALSTRDLWYAPMGFPALLHHAARLDSAGLGPYLGNIRRLARDSRDVVDLARIARDAAAQAGDEDADPSAWLVLLSRGCSNHLLYEVVDDLGDSGRCDALIAILDRVTSRPIATVDIDMVMRLRDAGLDNADHVLAARGQRIIVRLRPDDRLEAVILASIEASGGEFGRAEAILRAWLARLPDDEELRERLLAARNDQLGHFAIPYGYGSPVDRRDTRLRRRGVLPDYPRRRGERVRAVDVS